ncbi:membrane protein [Ktedonobacter sp. SOSP1-52]|uniref:DMT family transporter n=1 Tax=Ktedonobacter sp. SOSP1-52 TaxID=2778366 RepID=UPI001916C9C3|nr:EamA family transporter [Ktedonobacter sp. SOSP1-52]GHO62302.1 membrane protein [Ktedonobacter sp. SOSP1-52]
MFSQPSSRRDFLLVVCASISWGTVGIANQAMYTYGATNALSLTFLRLAIAAPLFFLVGWIRLGRRLFHIKPRDLCVMMLMGSLIALSQACYIAAIASAGVGVSTLIAICAAPVIIAVCSTLITRERLTLMTLIALVAALSGTILLIGTRSHAGKEAVSPVGIGLAFLSACGYAGFILCGRLLTNKYHPVQISAVAFGTGALMLLVCASATDLVLVYPAWGWLILLYLGSIPTALGYGLFQMGIRSLSATVASIVTMCEPLTAALLAWLLFREELGSLGLLGAGFLLGAMALILLVPTKSFTKEG